MKETSEGSRISGKFLPVKRVHSNAAWGRSPEGAVTGAVGGGRAGDGVLPAACGGEGGQHSQPAARPTPHRGDSSDSMRIGRSRAGPGSRVSPERREVGTGEGRRGDSEGPCVGGAAVGELVRSLRRLKYQALRAEAACALRPDMARRFVSTSTGARTLLSPTPTSPWTHGTPRAGRGQTSTPDSPAPHAVGSRRHGPRRHPRFQVHHRPRPLPRGRGRRRHHPRPPAALRRHGGLRRGPARLGYRVGRTPDAWQVDGRPQGPRARRRTSTAGTARPPPASCRPSPPPATAPTASTRPPQMRRRPARPAHRGPARRSAWTCAHEEAEGHLPLTDRRGRDRGRRAAPWTRACPRSS